MDKKMLMEIWDVGDSYQYFYPNATELSMEDIAGVIIGLVESFKNDNVPAEYWKELDEYVAYAISEHFIGESGGDEYDDGYPKD